MYINPEVKAVLWQRSDNQYGAEPVTYPSIAGNIRQKPGFSGFYSPEKSGFC
ncbi:hypothetical protein [Floridanema aerugineum]|jgi:hypothetical protein|uniref:Uncharacterized protein n=1 Tax=Floridaenema aerugineum BLCC-F46 TaxID=3153654 RepID=A0ABV4WYT2_9CYAN